MLGKIACPKTYGGPCIIDSILTHWLKSNIKWLPCETDFIFLTFFSVVYCVGLIFFFFHFPQILGRNLRTSPFHEKLANQGAFFGQAGAYERPLFYLKDKGDELTVPKYDWLVFFWSEIICQYNCSIISINPTVGQLQLSDLIWLQILLL